MTPIVDDALTAPLVLFTLVVSLAAYVWAALALAAMFRKMGEESWKGWVPFLNVATVLTWGSFSPWLVLIVLVPIAGPLILLVLLVVSAHRINPGFGYGTGMTVLAAVLFVVWASILGFGPARWLGARPASWRPAPARAAGAEPRPASSAPRVIEPSGAAATALPAPETETPAARSALSTADAFAPPPARTGPVWVPPDITTSAPAPRVAEAPVSEPAPSAELAESPPEEISWPSEIDDVSAVSPSPFPPSSAAGRGYAAPPLQDASGGDAPAGPIAFVPGRRTAVSPPAADPSVTRVPAGAPGTRRAARTDDAADPDEFPELSGEVSAVVGAPSAGSPRSARRSVSAQQRRQEPFGGDEDEDDLERTVIARRLQRPAWELVTASGAPLTLTAEVVILGRRPASDPTFPRAQLLAVPDTARTVSKTHARIELRGEKWIITDLASTNGVLLRTLMGEELEIEPGTELQAGERFFLGDEEFLLQRAES